MEETTNTQMNVVQNVTSNQGSVIGAIFYGEYDRRGILALALGGGLGAALSIGLLRLIPYIVLPTLQADRQFHPFEASILAFIFGSTLTFSMLVAYWISADAANDPFRDETETASLSHAPTSPHPTAVILTGAMVFGAVHLVLIEIVHLLQVYFFGKEDFKILGPLLVIPCGFVAGLGISTAVYWQLRGTRHDRTRRLFGSILISSLSFAWAQGIVLIFHRSSGLMPVIILNGQDYVNYLSPDYPGVIDFLRRALNILGPLNRPVLWASCLSVLDAATVGATLSIGITIGVRQAYQVWSKWIADTPRLPT